MALSAPVAEALVSAVGVDMLTQPRNLAVSWPWFALGLAAVLVAGPPRLAVAAVGLVLAGFAVGAAKMVGGQDFRRPDFIAAARFIDREAAPSDYVIDGAVAFLAPGPVTGLDAALDRRHPIIRSVCRSSGRGTSAAETPSSATRRWSGSPTLPPVAGCSSSRQGSSRR